MDDYAPSYQLVVPIDVPEAVRPGYSVLAAMQKTSTSLLHPQWVDTIKTLPDPVTLYAIAQCTQMPSQCFLTSSGKTRYKASHQLIKFTIRDRRILDDSRQAKLYYSSANCFGGAAKYLSDFHLREVLLQQA